MGIIKTKKLMQDQQGVAAIIVTVSIIIVLSLIVVAFSQASRREQRQSLDRQLSSQAFYAAESGVNAARDFIKANPGVTEKTNCNDMSGFPNSGKVDANGNAAYTCVLFQTTVSDIKLNPLKPEQGKTVSLSTTAGTPTAITFEWEKVKNSNVNDCYSSGDYLNFPAPASYGNCPGMLRLSFVNIPNVGSNREQAYNDSYTVFLRPLKDGASSSTVYSSRGSNESEQGAVQKVACSGTRCSATVSGLPSGGNKMYLRIRPIYNDVNVDIKNASGSAKFNESQASIDSTGKASDVLRRIEVRVPLFDQYDIPDYALETIDGLCKQYVVYASGLPTDACTP